DCVRSRSRDTHHCRENIESDAHCLIEIEQELYCDTDQGKNDGGACQCPHCPCKPKGCNCSVSSDLRVTCQDSDKAEDSTSSTATRCSCEAGLCCNERIRTSRCKRRGCTERGQHANQRNQCQGETGHPLCSFVVGHLT